MQIKFPSANLPPPVLPSTQPLSLLDKECTECLYWRAGALLYMFCHTVMAAGEGDAVAPAPVDHSVIKKVGGGGGGGDMHTLCLRN